MSLLDLKTDLKSLKYGNDQPGGGSSGQPYQKVDINTVDSGFNRFRMTKFDDGLVRGGVVGAANAAVVDTLRIGKFLKDFPKGPLFIVKQVGLQLSNPKLESKKGVSGFFNTEQTRIYNLGINTLAQVPVGAFGIHLNRHGLLPVQDDNTKYLAVAQFNNTEQNNRLSILRTRFNIGDGEGNNQPSFYNARQRRAVGQAISGLQLRFGIITKPKPIGFLNANKELTIDRYMGGPGSVYGIGATTLLRTAFTEDRTKIDLAIEQSKKYVSILLREGHSNLYPITANYNSSKFNSTPFDESLKDGTNLRPTLDLTIASNLDTGSAAIKNGVRSIDANINLREGKFLKLSNKANSDLNPEFFLDNYQKISSESDNQPLTLIGYNQVNNYPSAVLLANNSKRNISYADVNKKAQNGLFLGASNYSSSFLAPNNSFNDSNLKERIKGLNELAKLKEYSGTTTWTPLNGNPSRIANVKADLGLSKLDNSIPTGSFSIYSNAIPYTTPTLKKYAELRKKVDAVTSIVQDTYTTNGVDFEKFVTTKVNISRNDPYLFYIGSELVNKFKRTNDRNVDEDTLALKFMPLDPFTGNVLRTLKFLGYITDYSENYDSSWNNIKYAGRNENFYIFNEFKRTATVGFNIPCFNANELEQKHCDMSELASVLAGKYQDNLLLGGIITRLKVGRYINDQPGIITNLNFSPIQDSSWDLDKELAFYLKVSFGFTLIHNFLPQYGKCGFIDRQPDPIPETVPEEDDVPVPDPPITVTTISDIPIARIDSTFNANLFATEQRAEFDKDKILPQTKAQTEAARKKFNSLKFSN
jgi:hypothetical protein